MPGHLGIGHTRWATHGGVTEANAHPHLSWDGQITLVHNGVIENYAALRKELEKQGVTFKSETDSEVLCNLISYYYREEEGRNGGGHNRFLRAVQAALRDVKGSYGIGVLCSDFPGQMIGARLGSSLISTSE